MSVSMVTGERSDRVTNSEIPQLDGVVSTASQESIESVIIAK